MDTLKPCPFCGGKAAVGYRAKTYPYSGCYDKIYAYCTKCNCQPYSVVIPNLRFTLAGIKRIEELKEDVAKLWNTRAREE